MDEQPKVMRASPSDEELRDAAEKIRRYMAGSEPRTIEEAAQAAQGQTDAERVTYWRSRCHDAERERNKAYDMLSRTTTELHDAYAAIRVLRRLHDRGEW